MKKKLLLLALSLVFAFCGVLGLTVATNDVSANAEAAVIAAVKGDANGFVTTEEWAGVTPLNFTGANEGTVKLATVGTNLFFLYEIKDTTKFTGADRIAFTIETDGVTQALQGNFDPWLTGDYKFGANVKTEFAYDEVAQKYVVEIGVPIGAHFKAGADVRLVFEHNDITTAEGEWGEGNHSSITATMKFSNGVEEEPVTPSTVITAVEGDANGFVTAEEWASIVPYTAKGANEMSVKLASVGTNVFFLYQVKDETYYKGTDKITFTFETNGKEYFRQGNFDNWLTASTAFGENLTDVKMEMSYNEEIKAYTVEVGTPFGENFVAGADIKVTFTFNDVTTADGEWGSGELTTLTANLKFAGQALEPEQPEEPTYDYVIDMITTAPSSTDWEAAEKYVLAPSATDSVCSGYVQLIVSGTKLYFRQTVVDSTLDENDRPYFKIVIGGKTQEMRGKYLADGGASKWLEPNKAEFASNMSNLDVFEVSYDDQAKAYELTVAFEIGEFAVKGAHVAVDFTHGDANGTTMDWADSHASYPYALVFSGTLYMGEVTEEDPVAPEETPEQPEPEVPEYPVDPKPTPGPENTDLGIVVVDLPAIPTESDWAKATAYELLPNTGNITGATGTIKIYTSAKNIFYRVEIIDATTNAQNDYKYVYLGNETSNYEARGNYKNWLQPFNNSLESTSPSLFEEKTTAAETESWLEGVYTFSHGFYLPEFYAPGNTIRLVFKHGDSRHGGETWKDGGYAHTIYFDQVLTFGEAADLTVRPEEVTDGFTAGNAEVSYNKADITWTDVAGADTYNMFVYKVNAEGSEEPYTHISIEGPIYAGEGEYSELISGLDETTDYAVQVIAYDADGEVIAASALTKFTTISRKDAMDGSGSSGSDTTPGTSTSDTTDTSTPDDTGADNGGKKGCKGTAGISSAIAVIFAFAAVKALKKKEN